MAWGNPDQATCFRATNAGEAGKLRLKNS